ncbi:30S ribosomal protein S16 [Ornithinimicrobium avium]|uniref:Small ribosomal subunit protein bS16 n=1 Tax=Ornithinimicrobium avium TaxID=2283195 RepID=A0A345NIL9_9MICO|nr:30S ribosomal protein S16 [Ornithinimicrobium avium]AXH94877.1 30S ribosomal protein S16 [Ornithinimicrobium avium]
MAVKIRLKRMGKIRAPFYRVVVMDSRTKRNGRAIEEIGKYHPTEEPSLIEIDSERAQYWLGVGAQPTEQVAALLKITGDWQTFKGEPGAEGTLKVKEPRPDRKALYEAALAAAGGADGDDSGATTRRKATKKTESKKADKAAEKTEDEAADKGEDKVAQEAPAEAVAEETAPAADTEGSAASSSGEEAKDTEAAEGTVTEGAEAEKSEG